MYRGKIIALGPPAELRENLSSQILLRLATSAPMETMRALHKAPGINDVAVFGSGLHVTITNDLENSVAEIRKRLQSENIEIRRLEKIQPTQEDVFIALIEAEEKTAE
jgi:ABC-2 type transport system ATP-binding protein